MLEKMFPPPYYWGTIPYHTMSVAVSHFLTGESSMHLTKNNTTVFPLNEPNLFVFYNRVTKCGSTTFNKLMGRNSRRPDFRFKVDHRGVAVLKPTENGIKSLENLIKESLETRNTVFSRHIFYTDMSKFGNQVLYINQLRDPVDRSSAHLSINYNRFSNASPR